jgi:hypothetical protein
MIAEGELYRRTKIEYDLKESSPTQVLTQLVDARQLHPETKAQVE